MTDERDAPSGCVDVSEAHRLLASPTRRTVLDELRDRRPDEVALPALARAVAGREAESDGQSLGVHLHHTHLPKLDAAGVVDYDPDAATVRYSGDPTVEEYLRVGRDE